MERIASTPLDAPGMLDQIGRQLRQHLQPSSNQVALLAAVRDRHQRALVKAVENALDRRSALRSLILAPVEGASEGTGEVRTALRVANRGHQAAVAAAVGVSMETRSVLSAEQRLRMGGFVPCMEASATVREYVCVAVAQLGRIDRVLEAGNLPSESEIGKAQDLVEKTASVFQFPEAMASLIRRLAGDNMWFWSVLPALRPRGVLLPHSMAGLVASAAGYEFEGQPPWCTFLAEAFDSAVLPFSVDTRRLSETILGLVLLTHGFLGPLTVTEACGNVAAPGPKIMHT